MWRKLMLSASEKLHNEALLRGQVTAIASAYLFLNGEKWFVEDDFTTAPELDEDLVLLTRLVLFPVAVVFLKTGKHV
jgi:hypothetical protein